MMCGVVWSGVVWVWCGAVWYGVVCWLWSGVLRCGVGWCGVVGCKKKVLGVGSVTKYKNKKRRYWVGSRPGNHAPKKKMKQHDEVQN